MRENECELLKILVSELTDLALDAHEPEEVISILKSIAADDEILIKIGFEI